MKKFSKFAVSVLFGASSIISSTHVFAADKITISINDKIINSDPVPYVLHGTTLVPLTMIKDLSGVQFEWDNANKMVTIQMKNQGYKLKIGDLYLTTDKEVNIR